MRIRSRVSLLATVVVIAAASFAYVQRQSLADWWRLRNYHPSASIQQLTADTTMTDYGRRLFLVNHPTLDSKSNFITHCTVHEQTIVLGCYVEGTGIYLLSVTDSRLEGVEQVTAAHEMLHEAYTRLSTSERSRVDSLLEAQLVQSSMPRLQKVIDLYTQIEPGDVKNELHSILGTEISPLSSELEAYYSRYFTDRKAVVAYANKYGAELEGRQDSLNAMEVELTARKSQIDQLESELLNEQSQLRADRVSINKLHQSATSSSYNTLVAAYNNSVDQFNTKVGTLKKMVVDYNALVEKYNTAAAEFRSLAQSLDAKIPALN